MNVNAIQKKLASLQKTEKKQEKTPQLPKFKPVIGKQQIRILPSKFDPENPFTEMLYYYNIGKMKVISSPLNYGEKDPIHEFAKSLRGTNDKENWRMAKKLDPKMRVSVYVIDRQNEEKGVQVWEFGKEIYETLLNYAADEEVGDFTDVMVGRDFKLITVGPESTGTQYNKTTIQPTMKTLPLSTDSKLVEKWLEEQPDIKNAYAPLPFEAIKEALQDWLTPEEEEVEEEIANEVEEEVEAPKKPIRDEIKEASFQLKTKTTPSEQFDDMFADDEDEESDLPWDKK